MKHHESTGGDESGPRGNLHSPRIAALDLGSRNFKAVLGEMQGRRLVTRLLDKRLVGLGMNVAANQGTISRGALRAARTAIAELMSTCEREGASEILAVATRAVRTAGNGREIVGAARDLGLTVEVASGEREGVLAYLAVTGGEPDKLVCELGSQSMQLAWRKAGPVRSISVAAGYERVYSEFVRGSASFEQARLAYTAFLSNELRCVPDACGELVCMAMNSMARFVTGMSKARVTDRALSHARIREKIEALTGLGQAEYDTLKASTPKADKVLAGLILFDYILRRTGQERAFIAETELPVGLIVERFGIGIGIGR